MVMVMGRGGWGSAYGGVDDNNVLFYLTEKNVGFTQIDVENKIVSAKCQIRFERERKK